MNALHFSPSRTSWAAQIQLGLERTALHRRSMRGERSESERSDWMPAADIGETSTGWVLTVDIPGVAPQNLAMTADQGVLTIHGERTNAPSEENTEPNGYYRVERASGKFVRRFTLPDTANLNGIVAQTAQGVLTVTIPKHAAVQPRRIEIAVT